MAGNEIKREDVAASFQKSVIDVLTDNVLATCERFKANKIAVAGGVASNSALRNRLLVEGDKRGIRIIFPTPILCTDNAAMIGSAAYFKYVKNEFSTLDLNAKPNLKLGEK